MAKVKMNIYDSSEKFFKKKKTVTNTHYCYGCFQ